MTRLSEHLLAIDIQSISQIVFNYCHSCTCSFVPIIFFLNLYSWHYIFQTVSSHQQAAVLYGKLDSSEGTSIITEPLVMTHYCKHYHRVDVGCSPRHTADYYLSDCHFPCDKSIQTLLIRKLHSSVFKPWEIQTRWASHLNCEIGERSWKIDFIFCCVLKSLLKFLIQQSATADESPSHSSVHICRQRCNHSDMHLCLRPHTQTRHDSWPQWQGQILIT